MIMIKVGSISDTGFTQIYFLLKIGGRKSNELATNGFGVALEKPQNNWVRVGHKISTGSYLMCSIKEYIGSATHNDIDGEFDGSSFKQI
jgi:hypothetical protein